MMQQIIKNRQITVDHWHTLDDDDSIPEQGDIIVSYTRWSQQRDHLIARSGELGIIIGGEISIENIKDDLTHFALIAIQFPAFKDGRGYSYARLLRDRYDFKGEIRAIGNILRDQMYYMSRCGFDAFAVDPKQDINDALNAFNDFHVNYQPAANNAL